MKNFLSVCMTGLFDYVKWLSKQTVGFLNAIFFLTMAGEIGGIVGTILIMAMILAGSYYVGKQDFIELSILEAIADHNAFVVSEATGSIIEN
jgi:hypothetical protein